MQRGLVCLARFLHYLLQLAACCIVNEVDGALGSGYHLRQVQVVVCDADDVLILIRRQVAIRVIRVVGVGSKIINCFAFTQRCHVRIKNAK